MSGMVEQLQVIVAGALVVSDFGDGTYEILLVDGTRRAATATERTIAEKAALKLGVDAERARREAAGCPVAFPDGPGTIQTRDATDFRNLNGRATAALILQAQGVTDPVMVFRDAGNVDRAMTPAEMLAVSMAVQVWVSDLYSAAWALKAAIDAAPDQTALDAIDIAQGWPA